MSNSRAGASQPSSRVHQTGDIVPLLRNVDPDDLFEAAKWLCDPTFVRQTETIEFTDLTTISHRTVTELGRKPPQILIPKEDAKEDAKGDDGPQGGLILLGCFRRGMPVQHTSLTIRSGGDEHSLIRLKQGDTNDLAVALLDTLYRRCSEAERGDIPYPLDHKGTEGPSGRRYVNPFWESFLGITGRNVNADWTLMRSRFEVSDEANADQLWREPGPDEIQWSVERALLAKLAARLAFSYIVSAWVPPISKEPGPYQVSFEFQERILDPDEQVSRVKAVERRCKKTFERAYREALENDSEEAEVKAAKLARDRLERIPQTYLGLLDPALDDPDDKAKPRLYRDIDGDKVLDPENSKGCQGRRKRLKTLSRAAWERSKRVFTWLFWSRRLFLGPLIKLAALAVLVFLTASEVTSESDGSSSFGWVGGLFLVSACALAGYLVNSAWRLMRLSTVVLPTWSVGSSAPMFEVRTPKEFLVWQAIIARPSNRGRSWKTRPAVELGRKAHMWWQDPSDRGEVPAFVPGRPWLLILELRARLSRDITLYGFALCLLASVLLLGPALINLINEHAWADVEGLGADTVATVLLLLPTAGGALLVRPGEDPIAARLLQRDRLTVALGAVAPSAVAVVSLVLLGWPNAGPGNDFWYFWMALGGIALSFSFALMLGFRNTRAVERSQPESRQHFESRRSPLDIPAPLPPLDRVWGRRFWERTVVRLAPKRGLRSARPLYSLVLPAEGSRVYTPPAPTVVCVIPEKRQKEVDDLLTRLFARLEQGRSSDETNDLSWVASRSLGKKVEPSEFEKDDSNEREWLRYLLRLQLANSRPSALKPFGNGGGLCFLRVDDATFGVLREGKFKPEAPKEVPFLLGDKLIDKGIEHVCGEKVSPEQMSGEGKQARRKLEGAIDRACLDFDALLIIDPAERHQTEGGAGEGGAGEGGAGEGGAGEGGAGEGGAKVNGEGATTEQADQSGAIRFTELKSLSRKISKAAAHKARRAGTGPGAHPWPSSLESPLAGESTLWRRRLRKGSFLSFRAPLLYRRMRGRRLIGVVQRLLFDHRWRMIPAAVISEVDKPSRNALKKEVDGRDDCWDWLNRIPRAYSRGVGAVDTEGGEGRPGGAGEGQKSVPERKIPLVLIAGNVASGKSDLALLLRGEFAKLQPENEWLTFAPGRENLFFQLLNTVEAGSDYLGRGTTPAERALVYLMQATFLEHTMFLLNNSLLRIRESNGFGVIGEYWPEYSTEVMARTELQGDGMTALEDRLEAYKKKRDDANIRRIYILLREDSDILLERAAKRQIQRPNERLKEETLEQFEKAIEKFIKLEQSPVDFGTSRWVKSKAKVDGHDTEIIVVADQNRKYREIVKELCDEISNLVNESGT